MDGSHESKFGGVQEQKQTACVDCALDNRPLMPTMAVRDKEKATDEINTFARPQVTRDQFLRISQFRMVPFHEKPVARQRFDIDGSVRRQWYLRSTTSHDLMLDIVYGMLFIQMSRAYFFSVFDK